MNKNGNFDAIFSVPSNEDKKVSNSEQENISEKENDSLTPEQMEAYVKEIKELKAQLPDKKAYERIVEIVSILTDYLPSEVIMEMFGVTLDGSEHVKNTYVFSEDDFKRLAAFVMRMIFEEEYPEFKDNSAVTNCILSYVAGIYTILNKEYKK